MSPTRMMGRHGPSSSASSTISRAIRLTWRAGTNPSVSRMTMTLMLPGSRLWVSRPTTTDRSSQSRRSRYERHHGHHPNADVLHPRGSLSLGGSVMDDRERELRQRINENLKKVYSGVYRREATAKRERKKTELELASALDIQLGHDVLERRELNKELNRLLSMKREMTPEENGAAEELQSMIDRLDYGLSGYRRHEQARFVRLWNKSRKQRYKL